MALGSKRRFQGAVAIAACGFLSAALAANQAVAPAQNAPANAPMTEDVLKNVLLLRGIPIDTFFDAMGMFASAMGDDCTFCHVKEASFDRTQFAVATPRIMRARQMIGMMNAINKQYFGGQPRVTCFTCHAGSRAPKGEPDFAVQYGPPREDPNARDIPVDTRLSANQIFDKYLQALGGAERLAKVTSFVAKGTYAGFDTGRNKVSVEIFAKAPAQQTMIVHMSGGDSIRTFDGRNGGWWTGPDTPLPLVTFTGGNLDRARLEATVAFPAGLRQAFSAWRVGRTAIDDREVQVVQGLEGREPVAAFYFDQAGLLVRLVRWTLTPVGWVATMVDYDDYRDVSGIKMPFKHVVTQTFMQMTVELSDVQVNAPIDAARFAKPAPSASSRPIAGGVQ